MRLRQLPPAGTPITAGDIFAWLRYMRHPGATMEVLRRELAERFGCRHFFFLATGRAAMAVLLRALQTISEAERYQVIVPAYTCYSVPSSIIKAGLQVRVIDIDPATLDYNYDRLESCDLSRVLAIVSANLYGLPNDLPRLAGLAEEGGTHLLDDAAQALGAASNGKYCGTHGIAGIFSLDKGKVITSMNGGIIVTDDDRLAEAICRQLARLRRPAPAGTAAQIGKLLAYSLLLPPSRYWLPARMPFLKLGETHYTTDYPLERYPAVLGGMAIRLLRQLHRYNGVRRANGIFYREALSGLAGVSLITEQRGSDPIYLRFPLLVEDPAERNRLFEELQRQGLGATCSYPAIIPDIPALRGCFTGAEKTDSGGRWVAERLMTLPTHSFVTDGDRRAVVEIIKTIDNKRSPMQPVKTCSD